LCYAKITPAVLQRGDFDRSGREDGEALGRLPKFALNDSVRATARSARPIVPMRRMA
jgi:hypothetical protein